LLIVIEPAATSAHTFVRTGALHVPAATWPWQVVLLHTPSGARNLALQLEVL
jgi:hypothetical protein